MFTDGSKMDQAIGSHIIKSHLVGRCNLVLRNLMDKYVVILWWVPWQSNVELARQSFRKDIGDAETTIRAPISRCLFALQKELIHIKVNRAWTCTE